MGQMTERGNRRKSAICAPPFAPDSVLATRPAVFSEVPAALPATCDAAAFIPAHDATQADQFPLMQELELERQRIAMDLHDGLGPLLTLIKLELNNAKLLMDKQCSPALARESIRRAEENVGRSFEELRRAVRDLRPAILDDFGTVQALRWLVRQFELSGIDVSIHSTFSVDDGAVPAALKIVIFRICQEMLNNVIKHAQASHVVVELDVTGAILTLSIADDGRGMSAAPTDSCGQAGGGGLAGIAWRAQCSNGKLTIDSAPGRGTRLAVRWHLAPVPGAPAASTGNDNPLASII